MDIKEFEDRVIKSYWYDKYFYYVLYIAISVVGLYFLFDLILQQAKYDKHGIKILAFIFFIFLIFLGTLGLKLIPNRYKIISVNSSLPIDKKDEIVNKLITKINGRYSLVNNSIYSFIYKRKWWSIEYKTLLATDQNNFFVTVQSRTGLGIGFIDFGGTEKIRQFIVSSLIDVINND